MNIFPSAPVAIPLRRPPALVRSTLEEAVVSSIWVQLFKDRLVGSVTEDEIRIRRVRPWRRNDFAPQFVGAISPDGSRLEGRFAVPMFPLVFISLWVGFVLLIGVPGDLAVLAHDGLNWRTVGLLGITLGMATVGGSFPWLGWWFGRSDREQIEALLRRAAGETDGGLALRSLKSTV